MSKNKPDHQVLLGTDKFRRHAIKIHISTFFALAIIGGDLQ